MKCLLWTTSGQKAIFAKLLADWLEDSTTILVNVGQRRYSLCGDLKR
jgi:hypothetical protein